MTQIRIVKVRKLVLIEEFVKKIIRLIKGGKNS